MFVFIAFFFGCLIKVKLVVFAIACVTYSCSHHEDF